MRNYFHSHTWVGHILKTFSHSPKKETKNTNKSNVRISDFRSRYEDRFVYESERARVLYSWFGLIEFSGEHKRTKKKWTQIAHHNEAKDYKNRFWPKNLYRDTDASCCHGWLTHRIIRCICERLLPNTYWIMNSFVLVLCL